ncbi:hypothetical protein AYO44_02195 [Planctomycetaceae bacterium SCGC AG-212-F19]|nr:hypothetical protein AYO44_02195 [Planctomycetaceae bacterium SCGC AG-212-F19]
MRCVMLLFAMLLLAGCARTSSPAKPSGQTSPAVATMSHPPASPAAIATRPSIDDQPIRTPAFVQKYDWKLQPGELKFMDTSRRSKHTLTLTLNATPAGSKVGMAVVMKTDLDAAVEAYKSGNEPKNTVAYHAGGEKFELTAPMPAVLPYGILVRNYSDQIVIVDLVMKAE